LTTGRVRQTLGAAMPAYIAMLRGINVSGHKAIKMESLRASFAKLGFRGVQTYVQSGNVIFNSAAKAAGLLEKIEKAIQEDFSFKVPVVLKTADELADIVKRNPFLKIPDADESKLHVTFLSNDPPKNAEALLQPHVTKPEEFHIDGRAVYLFCPNGYGRTKLTNTAIEKKFSCRATTRNWNTTKTLLKMAAE
jgi:uncharacterized protein (DUF1697 family)